MKTNSVKIKKKLQHWFHKNEYIYWQYIFKSVYEDQRNIIDESRCILNKHQKGEKTRYIFYSQIYEVFYVCLSNNP